MSNPPVGPPRCLQNLVMLLQDLPETCEVQVLQRQEREREESGVSSQPLNEPVKDVKLQMS